MAFPVQGKTALVTGSNRGIGQAIVTSLLHHGAAKVYASARRIDDLKLSLERWGARVLPLPLDVSNIDSVRAAAKAAHDVDLVINNAGVLTTTGALDAQAIEALTYEMEVNVNGQLRMAQTFAPQLAQRGGGAFVQLNSVASIKCFSDLATYCASKAAAYSITQALRDQLRSQRTFVMSVHPGPIATDMARQAGIEDGAERPEVVAEAIMIGLAAGSFHVFPDTTAQNLWKAYRVFGQMVVEADVQ